MAAFNPAFHAHMASLLKPVIAGSHARHHLLTFPFHLSPPKTFSQCFEFKPDPALQKLSYRRSGLVRVQRASGLHAAPAALADLEAAENLGSWVIPALCRCMSLDSILTFLGAALQEAQVSMDHAI